MGVAHFQDAPANNFEVGHLRGRWTDLGAAAGSVKVGVRRIELPVGGWSTPVHEHGRGEELFYVLAGRGISWRAGKTAEIAQGDCILYPPGRGAHTLHAPAEPLDVLAFGPRERDEAVGFPRLGMSFVGRRMVASEPGAINRMPAQFAREAQLGPPELPDGPGERLPTIVAAEEVEAHEWGRGSVETVRRDLGRAVGSCATGLKRIAVAPGKLSGVPHCHSLEEELFVILDGEGMLLLGDEEIALRAGAVVARPAGTGVAHAFRAEPCGLELLAYGTREPGDICYYPRSNKVSLQGVGVIGRIERLDYWDGEE